MFMWRNLPWSMIAKMAKMTRVPITNPIRTKHPVLLTAMAVVLAAGASVGIGLGVGVVNGGSEINKGWDQESLSSSRVLNLKY